MFVVPTPAEWTIHLGAPVVPDEYMINRGWLNGSCSNSSWGNWSNSPHPRAKKSSINTLRWFKKKKKQRETSGQITTLTSVPRPCANLSQSQFLWFYLQLLTCWGFWRGQFPVWSESRESPPLSLSREDLQREERNSVNFH